MSKRTYYRLAFWPVFLAICWNAICSTHAQQNGPAPGDVFRQLTLQSRWTEVARVPLKFNAHHTQGMVKIGDDFYMTAVEVRHWPRRYPEKEGKFDRDTGEGIGHLFRFNGKGELLNDIILGEGTIYHPGGLDFDGTYLWIPVCEYRPYGASLVYRVNVSDLKPEKLFRVEDALGALAFDSSSRTLLGANWGSRDFYVWKLDKKGGVKSDSFKKTPNPSFYIDYQDCHGVGNGWVLCAGLNSFSTENAGSSFRLGGLDLVSMDDLRPVHQLPVNLRSATGKVITQNPAWLETHGQGLRAYFVPDDDLEAVLYVFDILPE